MSLNDLIENEILIVDDVADNLKLLSDMLKNEGYSVRLADSGELALQSVKAKHPSLILLDVMMPEMDGFEVCRQLKADENTRDIPVIFISALTDEKSKLTGFRSGGVDFISKPFRKEEVLARVKTHITISRMQLDLKAKNDELEHEIIRRKHAELAIEKRMIALTQPLDNSIAIDFDELFNVTEIQKLQDQFASAFGVASVITQPDGTPITKPSNFSRLCQNVIRCTDKGLKNCIHSDAVIGRHNQEGPIVQPCLSGGLWDAGASITVSGHHVANWLIGQVRNGVQQENKLKEYAKEIGADEDDFMNAFYEIPSMSQEQFHKIAEMLFTMAGQLSDMAYQNVQQARFINGKKLAEEALLESENRFRATLYSIGDGVITTDTQGRIRIMNPVAEQLTGWTQLEASGKSLEEVFRIINEGTRMLVEIPVRKVLRDGYIVGLANHTLLIAKDGTERPIADSGAPIRNENNEIVGVVLVFRDQTEERKAEKELVESEERYNAFVNANVDMTFVKDDQFRYLMVNEAMARFFNRTKGELLNKTDHQLADNNKIYPCQSSDRKTLESETAFTIEEQLGDRIYETTKFPLHLKGGKKGIGGIMHDITSRKQAEDALKESEDKFRSLAESSPFAICIYQGDHWVYTNPAGEAITGYTSEELCQLKYWGFVAPEYRGMIKKFGQERLNNQGAESSYEFRIVTKDGIYKWVYLTGNTIMYQGKPAGIISVVDISERKKAEEALLEAEARMNAFFDQSLDGFFFMMLDEPIEWNGLADKDNLLEYAFSHQRFTRINDALLAQYGANRDEFIGLTPNELFAHDIIHGKDVWRRLFDDGKLHAETNERKLNGEQIIVEVDYTCLHDPQGRIVGHFGIQREITQNKIAVDAIKNERRILRTLIDQLPYPIYVKDKEARKIVANLADVENICFLHEAEVLGKTDLELFEGEIGLRGYEDDLTVIQKGLSVINREEVFYNKNGKQRWLLTSKIPLFDQRGGVIGLVGIGRDITEQKKANDTIQKLSKGIEQNPSSIVITDTNGNIEYVNPKFSEITGYTAAEVIGRNPRILKSGKTPAETYKNLWETISSGEVWRGEFLNRKKNGELYWEWAIITSIKNDIGLITNYIAIKEDISSRKQMEADLIVAKEKAEENDRLKSAFLANMSHEIRTPLNSIIGFSEILADPDFDSDERFEFAQIITNSGNNLLAIISDIMDISKIEAGQVEVRKNVFSAQKLIQEVHNEYKFRATDRGIDLMIDPGTPNEDLFIESDQTKLKQVLVNFVGNALKFTEKGVIEVGLKVTGNSVQFHVKDSGIGIPEEYHKHVFERFRQVEDSTTRKYGGNGLGLAISKSLIEMLGGTIGMKSGPGEGSIFYFTLPDVVK